MFAAKSREVAVKKRPRTTQSEGDEADYAVVRPLDVADNDDVNSDYDYPISPEPGDNSNRHYLTLIPEPDEPLKLLAVFTRPEIDFTTSASGADDDVTKQGTAIIEGNGIHDSDALDSAANDQQPSTYIEII